MVLKGTDLGEMNRALDRFEVRPGCPWEETSISVAIEVTPGGLGQKWGQLITMDIGEVTQVDGRGKQSVMSKTLRQKFTEPV
jgi:hypothetical protein